jgi:serine/threonine protein kinase
MEHAVVQTDADRYVIVEYIAEGGMGAIFLGKKLGMGGFEKEVVLKQLLPEFTSQPEFIDLFLREAKLSAALDHANIVHTIDLVAAGTDYFIVMEYVRGGDLRGILRRIKQRGEHLSPAGSIFIAREILSALAYAHEKNSPDGQPLRLIHRDVSPSNIMVSSSGEVKLADFGIAKASTHKSVFYRVKGKVGYMSPEQAYGRPLDHRSDLYSLAVCLHEMLSGERLFVADLLTTADQIYHQRIRKFEGGPDMPQGIDRVLSRALAINPDNRYQTALELQDALVGVAYDSAILFSAPELAAHLKVMCGEDPSRWNREIDEGDGARPGTEVLAQELSRLSSVELNSIIAVLPPAGARSRSSADAAVKAEQPVHGDDRSMAFEPTMLRSKSGVAALRRELAAALAFDLSDLNEAHEASSPAGPAPASFAQAAWPPEESAGTSPWPTVDADSEPTRAMRLVDLGTKPPAATAPPTDTMSPPRARTPVPAPPPGSAVSSGDLQDSDATAERPLPGAPLPHAAKHTSVSASRRVLRTERSEEVVLEPARAPRTSSSRGQGALMITASVLLLLSGAVIAAIVGLSGPNLDDAIPPSRRPGPAAAADSTAPPRVLSPGTPDSAARQAAAADVGGAGVGHVTSKAKGPGVMRVESFPPKATVYLDSVRLCETPCTIDELEEDRVYVLSVRRDNYVSWSSLVDTHGKKYFVVSAYLSEEPDARRVGYVFIRSSPTGDVSVDGKEIGRVTSEGRIPLPPSQYEISLSHPRYRKHPHFVVTIYAQQTVVFDVPEKGAQGWR